MSKRFNWDVVFATASWIIVGALLFSAVSLIITPPGGAGPIAQALGVAGAQVFYGALYVLLAALLAYSKAFKKKRMRKHVLLVIYLTGFFTSILTITIVGFSVGLIDNLIISAAAAGCWLYWKFRTEYIDPKAIYEKTVSLRHDLP